VARYTRKSLIFFDFIDFFTGAQTQLNQRKNHKKTPTKVGVCQSAPLLIAEFLRNLTCGANLVNPTHKAASKMSVG
jgi:hypothetical protein